MVAPFTLALTLVTAAPQAAPPASGVEVTARITRQNGRIHMSSLFTTVGDLRTPQTMFVYVPDSVCDGIVASKTEPPKSVYAWRIFVGPVTYAPASRAAVRADVMLTTQRLWSASKKGPDKPMFLALPTQTAARSGFIDSVPALSPPGACDASTLTLEAHLQTPPSSQRPADNLVEAELWFVHKAPDGKETSQRQTVRMREGNGGDFYFDDMPLTIKTALSTMTIAVEVFGRIHVRKLPGNEIYTALDLTRRYILKDGVAFGTWPKAGKTAYPINVKPDEVVSFLLPPLEDDNGMLLGHRFSVRLRIKALDDE